MEPIFTDKQLNNMSREDLISLMKIVQEQTKKLFRPNGVFGKSSHSANQCIHFSHIHICGIGVLFWWKKSTETQYCRNSA